ncbi:MAG: flagellar biosynthesis protein FlhF-like protein, partial [Pseudomonadota bacterium]
VIRTHQPASGVILDTPGVSPFDPGDFAALRSFQQAVGAEPVLVLPASGDAEEFIEWAIAFGEFGVRRAIITKFDATKRVGAALCAVHAANLALAHLSETAFISEGLHNAAPDFLAKRILASSPGQVG